MLPPLENRQITLAVRVARAFTNLRRLAYAQIDPDLRIVLASDNFHSLLSDPAATTVEGELLSNLLWEFIGLEEALQDVLSGKIPHYQLGHINRERADGSIDYLTLSVVPLVEREAARGLLLIVEDITEVGRLEQRLVQATNELSLLQARMDKGR